MKKIILLLCISLLSFKGFSQAAEAAIKQVLARETTAFFHHDFKASYAEWHVIPQSVGIVSHPDGSVLYLTDKELEEKYTAQQLTTVEFPDTFERSNWKFRINATDAFLSFDQKTFKGDKIAGQSHESRYMEKVGGVWKIISMTVAEYK